MDIKNKAKDELEKRIHEIENYIAKRGVGSGYLNKAQRIQRNLNLALAVGAVVTIAGIATWALLSNHEEE
ncbi:hypothetical protein OO013_02740 [Mangrovivirga sp. M17]|uniref:Uncharacterized protein n=1 Tax=Mangrovivirga halotolerans TaxID=2993936 RepID=A0ABT3RN17_9BACT|nr:hypothetical protein [Mangrovivirga halotolerans]MCX2742764.1 hypothetical protein [Mangrovivirga halotolerans]